VLEKAKRASAKLAANELEPPAEAAFDRGVFVLDSGVRVSLAGRMIVARRLTYARNGALEREEFVIRPANVTPRWEGFRDDPLLSLTSESFPRRRRVWRDAPKQVIDIEVLVIADKAGAVQP
jgi:hypothetical protein